MGKQYEVIIFGKQDPSLSGRHTNPIKMNDAGQLLVAGVQYQTNAAGSIVAVETNVYEQLLTSSSRTATTNSSVKNNYFYKGAHFVINVTSITATPSVVPVIQARDDFATSTYYEVLRGTAITTTGINVLKVFPGITPVPNLSANDILPVEYRLRMEHADADAITYTAYASLIK